MAKKDKKKNDPEPVIGMEAEKKDKKKKKSEPKTSETLVRPKKKAVSPEVAINEEALIQIDNDAISLRAYFIGEQRLRDGAHGDSHGDWVEAERQLRHEAKKKKKK